MKQNNFQIAIYIYIYIYIYVYIYTYYIKGNNESEKIFLLKTFRRRSSTSFLRCKSFKIFCSDIYLNFFLVLYKYVTIKLPLYKYIGEQLNYKKTLKIKQTNN